MALTELKIKSLTSTSKIQKISDGGGLVLFINPKGNKYWRYNFRFENKQKTLSIGVYPAVSLAEARKKHIQAKLLLAEGIDPTMVNKTAKDAAKREISLQFESVARDWWNAQLPRWKESHSIRILRAMEVDIFPVLGGLSLTDIKTPVVLDVLRQIEARGVNDTALRALQRIKAVFNFGIQTGLIEYNPALALTGVILKRKEIHHHSLKHTELTSFFENLYKSPMKEYIRLAMIFQVIWFVRPGELRKAEWSEFNFEKREWHIPAEKMKMQRPHVVPLSNWALELLGQLHKITGSSSYLFPNYRDFNKPMSENALSYVMARMGYKGQAVPHGFRSLATDILNEHDFKTDVIERQLAHIESNKIRAAYHRAEYLSQRHEMMEWYSDWIRGFIKN